MGSRDEYNTLMRELLRHIEQVAILGANIQFKEEIEVDKPIEYLTCCEKTKNYLRNNVQSARYKQIVRFHSAYMKYFVFASDPYAEIVIPLSPSSLSLFIWKHQFTFQHTSKTIIEFLQVDNPELVASMYIQSKNNLMNVMAEMRLPYNIKTLTKIRHETFRKNRKLQRRGAPIPIPPIRRTVSSTQKTQIIQLAPPATGHNQFQSHAPMQPMQMRLATYEQHSYVSGGDENKQHMLQLQSSTMETVCATNTDTQMQIPTITSPIMTTPAIQTNENCYQVITTNGQPELDAMTMPVYLISSIDPITVEISSSVDDLIGFSVDGGNDDQTWTILNLDNTE